MIQMQGNIIFPVWLAKAVPSKIGLFMLICDSFWIAGGSVNLLFLADLEYPAITHTEKLFDGLWKSGCTKGMSCANHEMVVTLEKKNLLSDRVKEAVITITQGKPSGFGMGDRFYMGTKTQYNAWWLRIWCGLWYPVLTWFYWSFWRCWTVLHTELTWEVGDALCFRLNIHCCFETRFHVALAGLKLTM